MKRRLVGVIFFCALVGLGVAGYSFAHHQAFIEGSFCTINETFDCDVVNRGPFSELFGIPVALLGLIGYGFIALAAALKYRRLEERGLTSFLLLAAAGGMGFSLYLTGIEAFVLKTWCLLCLTSQSSMLILFICTLLLWRSERPVAVVPMD